MGCEDHSGSDIRPHLPFNYQPKEQVRSINNGHINSVQQEKELVDGYDSVEELEDEEDTNPKMVHRWSSNISLLCVVASPKRNLIFCGTQDCKILVFDLETYSQIHEFCCHSGSVLCLALNHEEDMLFSGSSDSTVKVYDLNLMKDTHTIYSLVDIGDIFSIAVSQESNTVFFGTQNASILYAHLNTIAPKKDPSFLPSNRPSKFFDSKSSSGQVHESQRVKHNPQTTFIEVPYFNTIKYAHNGFIYSLKLIRRNPKYDFFNGILDSYNEILVSTGGDGMVKIWGVTDSLCLMKKLENEESTLSSEISGSYLYCGLADGKVTVWDLSTFQHIRTIKSDENEIFSMAIFNDCLFKGTKSGVTKWKLNGDHKSSWIAHQGLAVTVGIFTSMKNDTYLITGGLDRSLILWDINRINGDFNHRKSIGSEKLNNEALMESLKALISFPTVSKKPETYMDDSRKCANYLKTLFKKLGAHSQLIPVENGNPIVYAMFEGQKAPEAGSKPRILWYGHYDVIEASLGHESLWKSNPYELVAENGYLYGRGVTDNKGPLLLAIYAVAEARQEGDMQSDVVFLIEGEEEAGSYGFQKAISQNLKLIGDIDWVLLSNSYWLDKEIPCLNYGLRGVISAQLEIYNDSPDRHSGFEGPDGKSEPAMDLMKVVSSLTDAENKVLIQGFYDSLKSLQDCEELENFQEIVQRTNLNLSVENLLAKWCNPSLSVHILDVSGPRNSTVIPHSASLTLSIRVVPEQDLSQVKLLLESHIRNKFQSLNTDNKIRFEILHESEPWLGDPNNLAFQILKKEIQAEWGVEPLLVREGGSIPSIRFLEKTFSAKLCQVPCGQSTDRAHLPNENLRIINLYKTRNILKTAFKKFPKNSQ